MDKFDKRCAPEHRFRSGTKGAFENDMEKRSRSSVSVNGRAFQV